MLFGLFFGAGNLIFPVSMGQQAGSMSILATIGFCVTGVGLPLLGIVALAKTNSKDVFSMSSLVGSKFAYFFTVLLYLCIGPLFAIPRAATVSFQVGIVPLLKENTQWVLVLFSFLFFVAVLYFSLRPSRILTFDIDASCASFSYGENGECFTEWQVCTPGFFYGLFRGL